MIKRAFRKFYKQCVQVKLLAKSFTLMDMFWMITATMIVSYRIWTPAFDFSQQSQNIQTDPLIYDYIEPGSTLPIHDAMKEYRE